MNTSLVAFGCCRDECRFCVCSASTTQHPVWTVPQGLLQGPLQQGDPLEHVHQVPLALSPGRGHLRPQLLLEGWVSGQLVQRPQERDGGLELTVIIFQNTVSASGSYFMKLDLSQNRGDAGI